MSLLLAYGSLRSLLSNSLFSNRSRMLQGNLKSNRGVALRFLVRNSTNSEPAAEKAKTRTKIRAARFERSKCSFERAVALFRRP